MKVKKWESVEVEVEVEVEANISVEDMLDAMIEDNYAGLSALFRTVNNIQRFMDRGVSQETIDLCNKEQKRLIAKVFGDNCLKFRPDEKPRYAGRLGKIKRSRRLVSVPKI